ncbi:hypothetical protein [Burkholderia glumae]|uniref:Uncharacterized protein n=1 Tax=Burkholderia glumae TaxID=337 RepID=A0AAP9Y0G0_BURGL|nr:hypothetical protein [Burkholderia glumae]ACR30346.1 Putative membrane protein [Burkholderia glumae BGR1]AJY65730.1 putative membrane protein [Burkholderia glumae LMG 2196 = ATCC 33617]KHJ63818.1 hypothetical protein NCPPB3923_06125 [Burkholderia glumae]MCM2482003.1 hypothetical protein [Burkholderia glumae]MCM2507854.1 hypothetical protein [Burkholderia glumae]
MFTMIPELSFGRRTALWWSCFWRTFLATLPVWLAAVTLVVLALLAGRRGTPNVVSEAAASLYGMIFYGGLLVVLVSVLCLPIVGYMTRRGFAAHGLTVPASFSFGQAVMLGLTTWGWTIVVSLATNLLSTALKFAVAQGADLASAGLTLVLQLLVLALGLIGTLYVVMPRQAWRLRHQAGG